MCELFQIWANSLVYEEMSLKENVSARRTIDAVRRPITIAQMELLAQVSLNKNR